MIDSFRNTDAELLVNPVRELLNFSESFSDLKAKADLAGKTINFDDQIQHQKVLMVDSRKLKRAIVNLVSNGVDAARSQVSLRIFVDGTDLCFVVTDDGTGVPDEFLPKLFQRGATYGKPDGTGLGLAYVRQIMRGHGGDVTYRRENNLTIFECRLPNAVEFEKGQVVENTASLEINLEQKLVRSVAICLEPETLSHSILARLASYKSDDFFFTGEREGANMVVSNNEDIMFEVLERDDQEFVGVANLKSDESAITTVLTRKFNLEPGEKIRV